MKILRIKSSIFMIEPDLYQFLIKYNKYLKIFLSIHIKKLFQKAVHRDLSSARIVNWEKKTTKS